MCLDHHTLYDSKTSQHKNYTVHEAKAGRERLYEAILQNKHAAGFGSTAPMVESESQRKLRAILPWKGKTIKLYQMSTGMAVHMIGPVRGSSSTEILDCTEFHVRIGKTGPDGWSRSIALTDIGICFDEHNRLELQERHE
jgi:hypothetical protein